MSSSNTSASPTFTAIDTDALDAVVGGRTSTSSTDTRVLDAINGLGASLKTLGTQNQAQPAGGGIAAMMPLLLAGGLGKSATAAAPACPAGCCAGMNPANVIRR